MKVIKTIQAPFNDPVEITYYNGDDKVQAIAALVMATADTNEEFYHNHSVRIEF